MRRQKLQLGVLAVMLIAVIAAYAGIRQMDFDETQEEAIQVLSLEEDSIVKMTYEGEGINWHLSESEGTWINSEDATMVLDQSQVSAMAKYLETLCANAVIEEPEKLSSYGLVNPAAVITAVLSDGSSLQLKIGDQNTMTDDFYVSATRSQAVKSLRTGNGFPLFGELVV